MILRERDDPHARPVAADGRGALDRGRPDRGRRRRARDRAAEPRDGRPRRALRPPRLHRLARPLPDVGALAAGRVAPRLRVARRGARPRARGAARTGAWLRGQGWRDAEWPDGPPTAAGARRGRLRPARDADLEGLPRALAQLGGARARRRRPRGRGRSRRARRGAASRPASSTRSPRGSSRRVTSRRPTTSTSPRCATA